jgi:hypothetical protein
MAVRLEIPEPGPAIVVTVQIGTELGGSVHLARAAPRGHDAGWRATERLGSVLIGPLTGGTEGLAGEARKRFWVAGALARWFCRLECPLIAGEAIAWPPIIQQDAQPQESQQQQLIEQQIRYHGTVPLTRW